MRSSGSESAPAQAIHSIIDGAVLGELAARDFGLALIGPVQLIQHGLNDHYAMRTTQGDYILRVYRHGWRTPDDIVWELALLEHLEACHVPVAAGIRRADGGWYSNLVALEGTRSVAIFQRAPGAYTHFGAAGRHRVSPADCAAQFGQSLAALHAASDSFKPSTQRFALNLEHLLDEPLRAIQQVYAHRPQELAELERLADQLYALMEPARAKLDWGACHGDCTGGNSTFSNNEVIHFDFDCGGPGWRAYDLAVWYWSMTINTTPDSVWDQFLSAYRSHRTISQADIALIPAFAAIRVIWLMGLWCQNAPVLGFHKLHDDYLERELKHAQDFLGLARPVSA